MIRDIWDFADYDLKDLFRVRDALATLSCYGLHDPDMNYAVKNELAERANQQERQMKGEV